MKRLLITCSVALISLGLCLPAIASSVDNLGVAETNDATVVSTRSITNYYDYASWEAAMGGMTIYMNGYAELGDGVLVTTQYVGIGATYTDGDDYTFGYGDSTDGMLLNGDGRIHISFATPMYGVGINFPGAGAIRGYMDGALVFNSDDFGSSGTFWFGGVVSTDAFNSVEIYDHFDDTMYLDDVFYGGGVTATEPAALSSIKALY